MKSYTKGDIISLLDSIDGDKPVAAWEYFVSIRHKEPLAEYWSHKFRDIQNRYDGMACGQLITEDGVQELQKLRKELSEIRP